MARYIDADKLKERIESSCAFPNMGQDGYFLRDCTIDLIDKQPTADVVEVDKVAEMFAEQFGDECPCNFNDNDEWLPYLCDHANTCDCPCKEGWKQFIKHYGERKEK